MHRIHFTVLLFTLSLLSLSAQAQTEAQATEDIWVFQKANTQETVEIRAGQRVYLETTSESGVEPGRYKIGRISGDQLWIKVGKNKAGTSLRHQEIKQVRTRPTWATRLGALLMILIGLFFSIVSVLGIINLLAYGGPVYFVVMGFVGLVAGVFTIWGGGRVVNKFAAKVVLKLWKWKVKRRTTVKKTIPLMR